MVLFTRKKKGKNEIKKREKEPNPVSVIAPGLSRREREGVRERTERGESVGWHGNSSASVPASHRSILDDAQIHQQTTEASPLSPLTTKLHKLTADDVPFNSSIINCLSIIFVTDNNCEY